MFKRRVCLVVFACLAIALYACLLRPVGGQSRPVGKTRMVSAVSAVNPAGLLVRDALVRITGKFTDEWTGDGVHTETELGGVMVFIGPDPQPLARVSPDWIEVVPRVVTTWLAIKHKDGLISLAPVRMVEVFPGIDINGQLDELERPGLLPLGFYRLGKALPEPIGFKPIPVGTEDARTNLVIYGAGWRHTGNDIAVTVCGVRCEVLGIDRWFLAGFDQVGFQLPFELAGRGECRVQIIAGGRVSNAARIWIE